MMPNTKRPCGCSCSGCLENMDNHCLGDTCPRLRNRRTQKQISTDGRYSSGRPRKRAHWMVGWRRTATATERPKLWKVNAKRRSTEVVLNAPSQPAAQALVANLESHGWSIIKVWDE